MTVKPWMCWTLRLAAVYNLAWGVWVILAPNMLFDLIEAPRLNYPQIWQCVGMIVGVYGVGYWLAARDPMRHWPIVLVGLLGKIFGPIGLVQAMATSDFPPKFGLTCITNDVIWWVPFTLILLAARRDERHHRQGI
jgi:small multidrug resistance pump